MPDTYAEVTLGPDEVDWPTLRALYGAGPLYLEGEQLVPAPAGDPTWGLLRELARQEWEDRQRRESFWRRPARAIADAWERAVCPQCARVRYSPACLALAPFHDRGGPGA